MAKTPAENGAAPAQDPAQVAVTRAIARALWERDFKKTNPDADAAAKKDAWTASRSEYVRAGRQFQMRLERAGLTITGTPTAEG